MNKLIMNNRSSILKTSITLVVWLCALDLTLQVHAQESQQVPQQALKYHALLRGRPDSNTLYDRFQEAWLEEAAIASLEEFLSRQSKAEDAKLADHRLLASFLSQQGRDAEALKILERELRKGEGPAKAWVQRAKLRARLLDFSKALSDLEQAAEQDSDEETTLKVRQLRGRYLLRLGKTEEALTAWKSLLLQSPQDEELQEDLIDLLESEKQLAEAIKVARSLVKKTKDPYEQLTRRLRLAELLESNVDKNTKRNRGKKNDKNKIGAIDEYAAILQKSGSGSYLEREAIARTEQIYRQDKDIPGWLKRIESWRKAEPNRLALRIKEAELLGELGNQAKAIAAWKEILKRTPGDFEVRNAYVKALASMQKYPEAIQQIKVLLAADQGSKAELEFTLAGFYVGNKQPEQALEALGRFRENEDRSESSYLRSITLLEPSEWKDRSREIFTEGRQKWPESLALEQRWADFLYDAGEKDEAREVWGQLIAEGDVKLILRIADVLLERIEGKAAYEMLESRLDDFGRNRTFLDKLCFAAIQAKQSDQAFGWARTRVNLSTDAADLAASITLAMTAARAGKTAKQGIETLEVLGDEITPQERNLLAELRDDKGWRTLSNKALALTGEWNVEQAFSPQARVYREKKEWSKAVAAQEVWMANPEQRRPAHIRALLELLARTNQSDKALGWITEWKKLAPASLNPWFAEAALARDTGRFDDSLLVLRQAVKNFPEEYEPRVRLAATLYVQGKLSEAKSLYWSLYDQSEDLWQKADVAGDLASIAADSDRKSNPLIELRRRDSGSVAPLLGMAHRDWIAQDPSSRSSSKPRLMDDFFLFCWLAKETKQADPQEVAAWVASAEATGQNPQLADTLRGLSLLSGSDGTAPKEAGVFFVALLKDEQRPTESRLQIGRFLADTFEGWPTEFQCMVLNLSFQVWDDGGEISISKQLQLFNQLPMDDMWVKTSERLESSFRRKYPMSRTSSWRSASDGFPREGLNELLEGAMRRGDYDFAEELIARYAGLTYQFRPYVFFKAYLEPTKPFLNLVKAGQHEVASRLLRNAADLLGSASKGLIWDDALREQAPLFLQSVYSPAERALAEAVFARLAGGTEDETQRRLVTAAENFCREFDAPPTSSTGQQAMSLLAGRPESRRVLRELLYQTVAQLDIPAVFKKARNDRNYNAGVGSLSTIRGLDREVGLVRAAIREAALEGNFEQYQQSWKVLQPRCPFYRGDVLRIDELGRGLTAPYEEWRTAKLSAEQLHAAWPIMRWISLQKLTFPRPNGGLKLAGRRKRAVPRPADTLRRFLIMTFAADRVADLAGWEKEWLPVWGRDRVKRTRAPLKDEYARLLRDPRHCASMLKEAKALCPGRTPEEWADLMEDWAEDPWLSSKTDVFRTKAQTVLQEAGLLAETAE